MTKKKNEQTSVFEGTINSKGLLEVELGGKKYTAKKPKARLWRQLVEFDENKASLQAAEFIEKHAEILSLVFDVDRDTILDECDLDEIVLAYYQTFGWVTSLLTSKLALLKNVNGGSTES